MTGYREGGRLASGEAPVPDGYDFHDAGNCVWDQHTWERVWTDHPDWIPLYDQGDPESWAPVIRCTVCHAPRCGRWLDDGDAPDNPCMAAEGHHALPWTRGIRGTACFFAHDSVRTERGCLMTWRDDFGDGAAWAGTWDVACLTCCTGDGAAWWQGEDAAPGILTHVNPRIASATIDAEALLFALDPSAAAARRLLLMCGVTLADAYEGDTRHRRR